MTSTFDDLTFAMDTDAAWKPTAHKVYNRKTIVPRRPCDWVNAHWYETDGKPFLTLTQWDAVDAVLAVHPDATVSGDEVTVPGVSAGGVLRVGGFDLPVTFTGVFDKVTVVNLSGLA